MANIKDLQQDAMSSIDAAKALVDKVLVIMQLMDFSPSLSTTFATNPIGFLMQMLKHLGVTYEELRRWLTDFLIYVLPSLEISIKAILLTNLKHMISCSVDPRIPDKYRKRHKTPSESNDSQEYGIDINIESIDFLNKLLKRKSDIRLGANGIDEIKNHSYFNGVVWEDYEQMKIESPFKFYKEDNFDKEYANKEDEAVYNLNKETFTNNFNESGLFDEFYYDINNVENDDDYEYPYMNQNNKVNNNQNKINENKTLSNADKHTKISSMNGVPTDIYGVNDNNNNNNEKGKESKINDNKKTINSNNEEGKYKYSKSRVERVIRNSVVDMT